MPRWRLCAPRRAGRSTMAACAKSVGAVWGGKVGDGRLLLGASVQGRHNPKQKTSLRYDDVGEHAATTAKSRPTCATARTIRPTSRYQDAGGRGRRIHARRLLRENGAPAGRRLDRVRRRASTRLRNIDVVNSNDVEIDQESYSLNGGYKFQMARRRDQRSSSATPRSRTTRSSSRTRWNTCATPTPYPGSRPLHAATWRRSLIEDNELKAKIEHERDLARHEIAVRRAVQQKERDNALRRWPLPRQHSGGHGGVPTPAAPAFPATPIRRWRASTATSSAPTSTRSCMLNGEAGAFSWEAGLRVREHDARSRRRRRRTQNRRSCRRRTSRGK